MNTGFSGDGPVEGAQSFQVTGGAYDTFMGRYSRPLAAKFVDACGLTVGGGVLDLGCGPGALTGELVGRLGAPAVAACDPSPPFVDECSLRHPGVDVRRGRAEMIPFADDTFDAVLAQLVLHFVSDPAAAASEIRRVLRPGGRAAACVWDFAEGMRMLRHFWDAALSVDPTAPDEARTLHFGGEGEIAGLLTAAGFQDVVETTLHVAARYTGFDDLWAGFLAGIGPAGAYCLSLSARTREQVQAELFRRLDSPTAPFTLDAVARCTVGSAPG